MQCLLRVIAFVFSIVTAKVMVMVMAELVFFAVVMTKVKKVGIENRAEGCSAEFNYNIYGVFPDSVHHHSMLHYSVQASGAVAAEGVWDCDGE